MAKSRLVGDYPVIGIRPTIDGRRGALKVRESLEEQTMNMALSAKKLFEENLRYSNGEPVKVIIADTTIGRVGEAARPGQLQSAPGNPPGALLPQVGRRQPDIQPQFLASSIA